MSQWEGVMQKHAKSFYLASLFFPRHLLPKVKALYALCRWLDDSVDEAPNEKAALFALNSISEDLHSNPSKLPVNSMYKENQLDVGYIDDLISGAEFDLQTVRIQNQKELIQYSYKVAGTVGLAMFDLMKVHPPEARSHAVDLGIAMQITNICRDVKEDLERNRIYVPLSLLQHYGISEQDLKTHHFTDEQMRQVITEMLHLADQYYESAHQAFPAIPWRTRGAIIIASHLYRGIGVKLLKKGGNPMQGRVYLTGWEKFCVVTASLWDWAMSAWRGRSFRHDAELHAGLESWKQLRGFQA
jgi:phytoene synthase